MNRIQQWAIPAALLVGAMLISASILFVGRWEISAVGYGYRGGPDATDHDTDTEFVYRLDRWTGQVEECGLDTSKSVQEMLQIGTPPIVCPRRFPQ